MDISHWMFTFCSGLSLYLTSFVFNVDSKKALNIVLISSVLKSTEKLFVLGDDSKVTFFVEKHFTKAWTIFFGFFSSDSSFFIPNF